MSKEHAEHNEKLSDFLIEEGNYKDWVITTAFYSALHFVHNEIFPLTIGTDVYNNFNCYYNAIIKPLGKSKHHATKELVNLHIPNANGQYRWLFDSCMNARYSNYAVSREKALQAKSNLKSLKTHLIK